MIPETETRLDRVRRRMFEAQKGLCCYCGEPMKLRYRFIRYSPETADYATFEHIKPKADGGTYEQTNMMLAHFSCNTRRQRKPVKVYRELNRLEVVE